MKTIISFLVGAASFIAMLWGAATLINLIVLGIQNHDIRIIVKLVIWIVSFTGIVYISFLVATFIGSILKIILGGD